MNDQINFIEKIQPLQEQLSGLHVDYWNLYSNFQTWQFWFMILILILPIITLYFLIDRKNIFLIGFYGFNIHAWASYSDSFGVRFGLWKYYYRVLPWFPFSFAIHISLFPVIFMLIYQWTLKNNKNFYLYSIAATFVFAIAFMPLLSMLNFFDLLKDMRYIHLFFINTAIILVSKMFTNLFLYMERKDIT